MGVKMGVKKQEPKLKNSKRYGAKIKLYHTKDKDIVFYATYKVKGSKVVKKLGKKSDGWSEKRAIDIRAKLIDKIRFGNSVHNSTITVGDLAVEYFEYSDIHRRNHQKVFQTWNKYISPVFDKRVVSSLKDRDIIKFQKALIVQKLADGTINKIVSYLTTVINFGLKKGLIEYFPFRNIEKIKIDNSRKRFLDNLEINKLYEALDNEPLLYRFVLIALNTGARASAIIMMKKSDFDFIHNKVKIFDMKRNMYYTNPLNSILKKEIEKVEDEILFPLNYEQIRVKIKPYYDNLFNNSGREKITNHSLRHTYASHLALKNTPLDKMQKLLNHADIKMTLRYAHLMPDAGEEFVQKLYSESE